MYSDQIKHERAWGILDQELDSWLETSLTYNEAVERANKLNRDLGGEFYTVECHG